MDSSPSPASSASPSTTSSSAPYTTSSGLSQAHQGKYTAGSKRAQHPHQHAHAHAGRRDLSSPGSSLSPERDAGGSAASVSASTSGHGYAYDGSSASASGASHCSDSYPAAGEHTDIKPFGAGYGASAGAEAYPDVLEQFEMDMHMAGLGFDGHGQGQGQGQGMALGQGGAAPGEYRGNLQDMQALLMQHGAFDMDAHEGIGGHVSGCRAGSLGNEPCQPLTSCLRRSLMPVRLPSCSPHSLGSTTTCSTLPQRCSRPSSAPPPARRGTLRLAHPLRGTPRAERRLRTRRRRRSSAARR